jgi:hypothetical protein
MSYLTVSWRPAAAALAALAIAALWLLGAGSSQAGNGGSVVITPASAEVGEGGTTTVNVDVTAPPSGLSIWIVEIAYDPTVVEVNTVSGNDDCSVEMLDFPGGVAGAAGCAAKDSNSDTTNDTAVAFGGWVENDGGTATGFSGTKTVASFTFKAVGSVGEDSPLTVTVTSFLGPNAEDNTPGTTNGLITIIEQQGVQVIWGDINCSGGINLGDAIGIARDLVDLPLTPTPPADCPDMDQAITVDGNAQTWGDITCSNGLGLGDAIGIARHLVSLTVTQGSPCPTVGSTVTVIES